MGRHEAARISLEAQVCSYGRYDAKAVVFVDVAHGNIKEIFSDDSND